MTSCAETLTGTIATRMGDGILALFGATRAHEDDAERAVRAGLRIVEEVAAYGQEVARSWDVEPLAARVGIDTGPVVVSGSAGQQVLGDALNTAARLQAAAEPGSVLVSGAVLRVVGPLFDSGVPRRLKLKGKSTAVEAVEIVAARPVAGKVRGLEGRRLPLIGREAEMAVAGRLVASVLAGAGGVLVVTGEAGTGKSRLVDELRQDFEQSESAGGRPLWLEGRCLSWGESLAYWPFRELIREWLGASPSHPALRTRVTLRRKADELFGSDAADVSAFLSGVLGLPLERETGERLASLPPEALRRSTFDALRALLQRLAEDGPVVVALDDLHWADVTSLQLIEHLLPATETAAVLLVLVLRTERGHGSWRVRELALRELAHRSGEVVLDALPAGDDARMLDELLGPGTLPPPTARELLEAAEGNPLFIEELVRSLVDAGALRHVAEGWRFEGDVRIEIPGSIEGVLASRIDRLPATGRAVLEAAAVLGRQFEQGLLAEVCEEKTDLGGALSELEHLQLLQQARRWPKVEYRFRHTLLQEAAYRRLVADRRRLLHRRAAHGLETLFPDRLAESYGVLAFHCQRAGELERAFAYHRLAGDGARRAHALDEASRYYSAALDLAGSIPPERAEQERPPLLVGRGDAWWQLADPRAGDELRQGLAAARAVGDTASELAALADLAAVEGFVEGRSDKPLGRLEEALAVARRVGDRSAEVSVQNRLTVALVNYLELGRALENGREALATARRASDEVLVARAMDGLKLVAFALGDYPALLELAKELEDVLRRHDDRWYLQFVLAESSFAAAARGDWEDAFRRLDEARAINVELDVPYLLTLQAWLERARGRYGEALRLARTAATAAEGRNTQWTAWAETNLGAILAELGAVDEAIEHLEAGRVAAERAGIRIQLVRLAAHLALARVHAAEPGAGAGELASAEGLLDQISLPPGKAFLYGLDAYLAVARVHLAGGEVEPAAHRLSPLLPAAQSAGWAEGVARSALVLGECSARLGKVEVAAGLFEQALEAAKGGGLPPVEWQAHVAVAGLSREHGDGAVAEKHLGLARALVDILVASIDEPEVRGLFRTAALDTLEGDRMLP
jgi:tetratricopeptide (TPR) repeat protein